MCHSCASSSPGCFVPATVFLCGKPVLRNMDSCSILDSRLRGNDTVGLARPGAASCFIRVKYYGKCYPTSSVNCIQVGKPSVRRRPKFRVDRRLVSRWRRAASGF